MHEGRFPEEVQWRTVKGETSLGLPSFYLINITGKQAISIIHGHPVMCKVIFEFVSPARKGFLPKIR